MTGLLRYESPLDRALGAGLRHIEHVKRHAALHRGGYERPDVRDTAPAESHQREIPSEAIEKYGLDTRHPDAFIIAIDDVDPGALIDAGRHDMAHYKNPPLTLVQSRH